MGERFASLTKVPKEPARRLLALANAKLSVPLSSPASANVEAVLEELDTSGAHIDILRLLSVALPPRECVWWGCLAAEDLLEGREPTRCLAAAQAWVFKPTDETREAARRAAETAQVDDDTDLCAVAVSMFDGKIGSGELAQYDAPPGGTATAVFAMNLHSLGAAAPGQFTARRDLLITRAVDIARGGNGRVGEKHTQGIKEATQ